MGVLGYGTVWGGKQLQLPMAQLVQLELQEVKGQRVHKDFKESQDLQAHL
jgi:hypothetical protein